MKVKKKLDTKLSWKEKKGKKKEIYYELIRAEVGRIGIGIYYEFILA